jgi:DNA-binding beta-propeller fold protein YncE
MYFCLAAALLTGCAQQQAVVKKRYFWPPLPDVPKIEWIGSYSNSNDLKEEESWLVKNIIGESEAAFISRPLFAASDGKGKVYVTVTGGRVYVFDFINRGLEPLGNEAFADTLERVTGVVLDDQENVYVADSGTRKIHAIDSRGRPYRVLDFSRELESIGFIAFDRLNKRLVIPDPKGNKVIVSDLEGKLLMTIGKPAGAEKGFNSPNAVAVESNGNIVVADSFNAKIKRFTSQGVFINDFGRRGDGNADFALIKGVAVDSEDHIYVSDGKASRIAIFAGNGDALLTFGTMQHQPAGTKLYIGGFNIPQGIYIDRNDRIYVADQLNDRFQVFQYMNQRYLTEFPADQVKTDVAK